MPTLTLKITGDTPVHGKKPGDTFDIETDADGIPTDILWRKRLSDEVKFKTGVVSVLTQPAPQSPASTSTPKKEQK